MSILSKTLLAQKFKDDIFILSLQEFELLNIEYKKSLIVSSQHRCFTVTKNQDEYHFALCNNTDQAIVLNLFPINPYGNQKPFGDSEKYFDNNIKEPTNDLVWFSFNNVFNSVDSFWSKIKQYYDLSPNKLNESIKIANSSVNSPVSSQINADTKGAVNLNNFIDDLKTKLESLKAERKVIMKQISLLKTQQDDKNAQNQLLVFLDDERANAAQIKKLNLNLERFQNKISDLASSCKYSDIKFFTSVFGKDEILSRYEEVIGDNLINWNHQLNVLTHQYGVFEKKLVKTAEKQLQVKKECSKIAFLEAQKRMEQVAMEKRDEQKKKQVFNKVMHMTHQQIISDLGKLHSSYAFTQSQIKHEVDSLQNLNDNLDHFNDLQAYKESIAGIRKEKEILLKQKKEFEEHMAVVYQKFENKENSHNKFLDEIKSDVATFMGEINKSQAEHMNVVKVSISKLWKEFSMQLSQFSNEMIATHNHNIGQIADIVISQIQKLGESQQYLTKYVQNKQSEWEYIFDEIKEEFRVKGYLLKQPKPSEITRKYIKELRKDKITLSKETQRVLFPEQSFHVNVQEDYVLGLEPKTYDDDQYELIDQVWNKLTPAQEAKLKKQQQLEKELRDEEIKEANLRALRQVYEQKVQDAKKKNQPVSFSIEDIPEDGTKIENMRFAALENMFLDKDQSIKRIMSHSLGQFKEEIYYFSKRLIENKEVKLINSELLVTNDGFLKNKNTVTFSKTDYFTKPVTPATFEEEIVLNSDQSAFIDEPGDDWLEIAFEDWKDDRKAPKPPSLKEMSSLSFARYKKEMEHHNVKKLKESFNYLDEKVNKIHDSFSHLQKDLQRDEHIRQALRDELDTQKLHLDEFFVNKEGELENIIMETEKNLDIDLSQIDATLQDIKQTKPSFWRKILS